MVLHVNLDQLPPLLLCISVFAQGGAYIIVNKEREREVTGAALAEHIIECEKKAHALHGI